MKKILLLLSFALLLSGCSFLATQQHASNLDLQGKCATQAEKFFNNYNKVALQHYNYQNHYNSKLDKCYILVHGFGTSGTSDILFNTYENNSIAECQLYSGSPDMSFCGYSGSSEKWDLNKFNNFVKQYMEE